MAKWPNMAQYGPIWPFANICVCLCRSTPELYSDVVCSIWAHLSLFEPFRARLDPYEPKLPTPDLKWQIKPVLTSGHLMVCYACVCYVCLYHMFNHTQVVFILFRTSLSQFWASLSHSDLFLAILSHPPQDCPNGKMAQYGPIWSNMALRKHMCMFV